MALTFPGNWTWRALGVDGEMNQDLLSNLSGYAEPLTYSYVLALGGPDVMPFDWGDYGVQFLQDENGVYDSLSIGGATYAADFGEEDYCVLVLTEDLMMRVAGITRYGTRAGLMWLMNNTDAFIHSPHYLLHWADLNDDGEVQLEEVSVVEWPSG